MSIPSRHTEIASLLIDLEAALRTAALWEDKPPDPAALASTQPFCIDTLGFAQWLQFVFLPRMYALLAAGAPLPAKSGIAAMAELHFVAAPHGAGAITAVLRALDERIAGSDP